EQSLDAVGSLGRPKARAKSRTGREPRTPSTRTHRPSPPRLRHALANCITPGGRDVVLPLGGLGGVHNCFREFVQLRCRPLIVAMGTAGETACPTLLDQSFGEVGGAGGSPAGGS